MPTEPQQLLVDRNSWTCLHIYPLNLGYRFLCLLLDMIKDTHAAIIIRLLLSIRASRTVAVYILQVQTLVSFSTLDHRQPVQHTE